MYSSLKSLFYKFENDDKDKIHEKQENLKNVEPKNDSLQNKNPEEKGKFVKPYTPKYTPKRK